MPGKSLCWRNGRVPPPQVQLPENEQLRCPRCASTNTKFCYYNNYNLSQPRHFCRSCKRYWTRGGTLRNIPVGGGTRKNNKRGPDDAAADSSSQADAASAKRSSLGDRFFFGEGSSSGGGGADGGVVDVLTIGRAYPPVGSVGLEGPLGNLADAGGSFTALMGGAGGQFGGLGDGLQRVGYYPYGQDMDPLAMADGASGIDEEFLNMVCEEGEWPDLSMYPLGSTYM